MNEAVKKAMKKLGDRIFESECYGTPKSGWIGSCPFKIHSGGRLRLDTYRDEGFLALNSDDLRNLADLVDAVAFDLKNQEQTKKANEQFLKSLENGDSFKKSEIKKMRDLLNNGWLPDTPVAGIGEDGKLQIMLKYENGHWISVSISENYFQIESSYGLSKLETDSANVCWAIDDFVEKEEKL